jgi:hypothetical protein
MREMEDNQDYDQFGEEPMPGSTPVTPRTPDAGLPTPEVTANTSEFEVYQNNLLEAAANYQANQTPENTQAYQDALIARENFFASAEGTPLYQHTQAYLDNLLLQIYQDSQKDPRDRENPPVGIERLVDQALRTDIEADFWQRASQDDLNANPSDTYRGMGNALFISRVQRMFGEYRRTGVVMVAADPARPNEWSTEAAINRLGEVSFSNARAIYEYYQGFDPDDLSPADRVVHTEMLKKVIEKINELIEDADRENLLIDVRHQLTSYHKRVLENGVDLEGRRFPQEQFNPAAFEARLWSTPKFRKFARRYMGLGTFLYGEVSKSINKVADWQRLTKTQRDELVSDPRYKIDPETDIGDQEYRKVQHRRDIERLKEKKWHKETYQNEFDWARNEEELIISSWEWMLDMDADIPWEEPQATKQALDQKNAEFLRMLANAKQRLGLAEDNWSYLYCKSLGESCSSLRGIELVNKGGMDSALYFAQKWAVNFHHEPPSHYEVTVLNADVALMLDRLTKDYGAYFRGGDVVEHPETGRPEVDEIAEYRGDMEVAILSEVEGLRLKLSPMAWEKVGPDQQIWNDLSEQERKAWGDLTPDRWKNWDTLTPEQRRLWFEVERNKLLESHPVFAETKQSLDKEDGLAGLTEGSDVWNAQIEKLRSERINYLIKHREIDRNDPLVVATRTGTTEEKQKALQDFENWWNNTHRGARVRWYARKWDYVKSRIERPEDLLARVLPKEAYQPPVTISYQELPDGTIQKVETANPKSLYEAIVYPDPNDASSGWTKDDIDEVKARRRKEVAYKFKLARRVMLKDLQASWYGGARLMMTDADIAQAKAQGRYDQPIKPFFIEFQERLAAIPECRVSWPERVANNDVRYYEVDQIEYKLRSLVLFKKMSGADARKLYAPDAPLELQGKGKKIEEDRKHWVAAKRKENLVRWLQEWNPQQPEEERFYPGDAPMRDAMRKAGQATDLPIWSFHLAAADSVRRSASKYIGLHPSQNHAMAHMMELERRMMCLIEEQIMEEWQRDEMINHTGGNIDFRRLMDMARISTTGSVANDLIVAMTPRLFPLLFEMGVHDYRGLNGRIYRRNEWERRREEPWLDVLDPKDYVERVNTTEVQRKLTNGGSVGQGERLDGVLNGGPLKGGYRMADHFFKALGQEKFEMMGELKDTISLSRVERDELLEAAFKLMEPTIQWMKNRRYLENRYGKIPKSWEWENTLAWRRIQRWMLHSPKFSDEAPEGFAYAEEARSWLARQYYTFALKEDHLILHDWPMIKLPKEVLAMRRPGSIGWRKRAEDMPTYLPNLVAG